MIFISQLIGRNLDNVLTSFIPIPPVNSARQFKKPKVEVDNFWKEEQTAQNIVEVKIRYPNVNHYQPIAHIPEAADTKLEKGQTLLTSFFKRKSLNAVNAHQSQTIEVVSETGTDSTCDISEYLPDPLDESEDSSNEIETNATALPSCPRNRIIRKYQRINKQKQLSRQQIVARFVKVCRSIRRFQGNPHVLFVYKCIIAFHRFVHVLVEQISKENMKEVQSDNDKMASPEVIMINRRVQRLLHDKEPPNDEIAVNGVGGTSTPPTDSMNKRLPKHQRANDSTKLLLAENSQDSSEKDFCK